MSRHGTLLPIPDDPRFAELLEAWPAFVERYRFPRTNWLGQWNALLSQHYPQSSSADRKLTARHYAPFPLALGPDVP